MHILLLVVLDIPQLKSRFNLLIINDFVKKGDLKIFKKYNFIDLIRVIHCIYKLLIELRVNDSIGKLKLFLSCF